MCIDTFETYKLYVGLKLHFSNEIFYFKNTNSIKIPVKTYQSRKDKKFFELLYNKNNNSLEKTQDYLISVFLIDNNLWIGDMIDNIKVENYHKERIKNKNALLHIFKQDIIKIEDYLLDAGYTFKQIMDISNNKPIIIENRNEIGLRLETLATISAYSNICSKVDNDDVIYNNLRHKILKYGLLLKTDIQKEYVLNLIKPLLVIN